MDDKAGLLGVKLCSQAKAATQAGGQALAFCAFTGRQHAKARQEQPLGYATPTLANAPRMAVAGRSNRLAYAGAVARHAPLDTPEQLANSPTETLRKRAGRRAVSHALAFGLMRSAKGPLMGKAYARTVHQCGQVLDQADGKLRTYWCGYRWCATCGAIRTARAMHGYGPTVKLWSDAQLVTLTIPNVSGGVLRQTVRDMHHAFAKATKALRYRFGKDAVQMIRTTEVTYNKDADSMHPHMHLLVHNRPLADALLTLWLRQWPDARRAGQDIRPADAKGTLELFKYATKLTTTDKKVVPFAALDVIYTALRGLRLWQPVGVTALTDETAGDDTAEMDQEQATPAISRPTETVLWHWQQGATDWVDYATGECLTGYVPDKKRAAFIATLESMAAAIPFRPCRTTTLTE